MRSLIFSLSITKAPLAHASFLVIRFSQRYKYPHPKVARIPHHHRPLHGFRKLDSKPGPVRSQLSPASLSAALELMPRNIPPAQHRAGHALHLNRPGKARLLQKPQEIVLRAADLQFALVPLEHARSGNLGMARGSPESQGRFNFHPSLRNLSSRRQLMAFWLES